MQKLQIPKPEREGLLYEESGLSQREIGLLTGHCDGSTVSRSLARIASTMAEDETAENRY
ncbi:MAG: hypothetical protein R6V56_08310 [Lentisphaeria bacterium]